MSASTSAAALKRTPFHDFHVTSGAKMVEFAGFLMPVQYSGIVGEHRAVRESVGIFDVSHMGEVEIKGPDALPFLQSITVNDVAKLTPGRVQYSAMCYPDGGIVDDLLVYHRGDEEMPPAADLLFDAATKRPYDAEVAAAIASRICLGLL